MTLAASYPGGKFANQIRGPRFEVGWFDDPGGLMIQVFDDPDVR
jgi:hypothetical protein